MDARGEAIDLAWAAGFVDGEGCFFRNRRIWAMMFTVVQVDRRPLDRFVAATGLGLVRGPYHPPSKRKSNEQPYHMVRLGSANTRKLIIKLEPYLSEPKLEQIERVKASLVST